MSKLSENTNRIQGLLNDISALPKDRYEEGVITGGAKLRSIVNRSITEITAEDLEGITEIGQYAFYLCSKLEEVELVEGITKIGNNAFKGCVIKSIIIPDSVTEIGSYAFHACVKLDSIVIGGSVESIGSYAFQFCSALSITVKANIPPTIQSNTFANVPAERPIYVPSESVEAYKTATNWSARADYIFAIEE